MNKVTIRLAHHSDRDGVLSILNDVYGYMAAEFHKYIHNNMYICAVAERIKNIPEENRKIIGFLSMKVCLEQHNMLKSFQRELIYP